MIYQPCFWKHFDIVRFLNELVVSIYMPFLVLLKWFTWSKSSRPACGVSYVQQRSRTQRANASVEQGTGWTGIAYSGDEVSQQLYISNIGSYRSIHLHLLRSRSNSIMAFTCQAFGACSARSRQTRESKHGMALDTTVFNWKYLWKFETGTMPTSKWNII